jgi:glycosyltransferase involved in cell wall biosynthesis
MARPGLSILLPCYNAEPFLNDCIGSLREQTFADFEVLAVDDGSTDRTLEQLQDWAAGDARVRLLAAPHHGLVLALQRAARAARAPLLARMDADDIAEPTRLAAQFELLQDRPELAACGTGICYFPDTDVRAGARAYQAWLNGLHEPEQVARDIFVECPIAHPTLMLRTESFHQVGGYQDRGWPEDYDLVLRLWSNGFHLANVPHTLHYWRERADRASRRDERYSRAAFRRCKVHYLQQTLLKSRPVVVWGAGPVGKAFARELIQRGSALRAFLDIDPRKVGQSVYGVTVLPLGEVQRHPDAFVVAAVGSARARAQIRDCLHQAGRVELDDCCAVA